MLALVAAAVMLAAAPTYAACGGSASGAATANCKNVGDIVTVTASFGPAATDTLPVNTGTTIQVFLDCTNTSVGCGQGGCVDAGVILQYLGDSTLSSVSCPGGSPPTVTITSDHPGGSGNDNVVTFTLSSAVVLQPGQSCSFTFSVQIIASGPSPTPNVITGNVSMPFATCVPLGAASGCGSYFVTLAPKCRVNPLAICDTAQSPNNQLCIIPQSNTGIDVDPSLWDNPNFFSYSWTGPGGFTASTRCITLPLAPGTYVGTVVDKATEAVTDVACSSTCTGTVNPHPTCSLNPCDVPPSVPGRTITGTISGGTPPYTCSAAVFCPPAACGSTCGWLIDSCVVSGSNFTINYHLVQPICRNVQFDVTISDSNGCQGTCSEICSPPIGCLIPGVPPICSGQTVTMCGIWTGTPPLTIVWSEVGGNPNLLTCPDVQPTSTCPNSVCNLTVGPLINNGSAPITHTYQAVVTDQFGPGPPCTVDVTVNPNATAFAGPNITKCAATSGPTTFNITGATATGGTIAWTVNGSGTNPANCVTFTGGNTITPTFSFAAGCTGSATITLTVTPPPPCLPQTSTAILTVAPNPNCAITITTVTSCPDPSSADPGSAGMACVPDQGANATYTWTLTGGTINGASNTPCINFTAGPSGTMHFTVHVDLTTGVQVCSCDNSADVPICTPVVPGGCRFTGGGNGDGTYPPWASGQFKRNAADVDFFTFGGQAGAPLIGCCNSGASPDQQPWGEWTHAQQSGQLGDFTFHAGTASAPPGSLITCITCCDPTACRPAQANGAFKQLDFEGFGTLKNFKAKPVTWPADAPFDKQHLYAFEVHIEDLGEPGAGNAQPPGPQCPPNGFLGAPADCSCPDFYRIRIHTTCDFASPIGYEVYTYLKGGNFQIHDPTGSHKKSLCGAVAQPVDCPLPLTPPVEPCSGTSTPGVLPTDNSAPQPQQQSGAAVQAATSTPGPVAAPRVSTESTCGSMVAAFMLPLMLAGWAVIRRRKTGR